MSPNSVNENSSLLGFTCCLVDWILPDVSKDASAVIFRIKQSEKTTKPVT
jgi:hypothetical protein